jgi:hypothetical protein
MVIVNTVCVCVGGGGYTTDVIRPLHTVLFMMKYAYYGHPTYRVL